MLYLVVPVMAMILAYVFIRGFKLDEAEQRALQSRIAMRDGSADGEAGAAGSADVDGDGQRAIEGGSDDATRRG
jgi:hypothetical protein